MEWFERLREASELNCLQIRISYEGANCRKIELVASGEPYASILERLEQRFG